MDPASRHCARMLQFDGACRGIFEFPGVLFRVDFLERFGQIEIDVVQAHLPLLNPFTHLLALFAILPFLGFRIEFLLSRLRDITSKRAPFRGPGCIRPAPQPALEKAARRPY
jgi:hypothetical protein